MRYSIDLDGVRIYDTNEFPFLFQPTHPEHRDWNGTDEMKKWAEDFIANFQKDN